MLNGALDVEWGCLTLQEELSKAIKAQRLLEEVKRGEMKEMVEKEKEKKRQVAAEYMF